MKTKLYFEDYIGLNLDKKNEEKITPKDMFEKKKKKKKIFK